MMPTMPTLRAASRLGARRSNMTAALAAPLGTVPMALRDHIYFARSSAEGPGRNGRVHAHGSDKKGGDAPLALDMAIPRAMGGKRSGQTPERLFSMAYSSCFLGSLQLACMKAGRPDLAKQARVHTSVYLGRPNASETGLTDGLGLGVAVDVEGVDDDRIIHAAHEYCPYSRMMERGGQVVVKKL